MTLDFDKLASKFHSAGQTTGATPLSASSATSDTESYRLHLPDEQSLPVVLSSPHSGSNYPTSFIEGSRLDHHNLRRSEDSFVDELLCNAPRLGAPLLCALFPRAFVDANREPFELDPQMFEDELPSYVNTSSPRVAVGLGTIARNVTSDRPIYKDKLTFAEAKDRIERYYWPYHQVLRQLVDSTKRKFGYCILIDCHSMPRLSTIAQPGNQGMKNKRSKVDFVLGDRFGKSSSSAVTRRVENILRQKDFRVLNNNPYPGGFITQHYGEPALGINCLQIEISRHLYMDEDKIERKPELATITALMDEIILAVGAIEETSLDY
ncbi:N-formylglutamate amidohydrolase [Kiloniella laminariae]|uniref:N-formylglutamate amidohydrolase n=1 Tax=Kiloniella laminariae TaxID=454162 RepID=UPI00037282E0|nr:N-formylglutamate amidohydrolase [Kiloniella laminariae]